MLSKAKHKISAFSMLELTVTLGITAVIMVMLSNVLVTSIGISQKSLARSFAREEISQVADAIASDIRSANEISNCRGDIQNGISCQISTDVTFTWTTCPGENSDQTRICKLDQNGNEVFVTSQNIDITVFTIEEGFEAASSTSGSRRNLLLTIAGDDVREGLGINNILRQTSISSRNYLLANAPASAVCGNSVVEVGETCDDGNLINGDGCRNDCRIETCEPQTETVSLVVSGLNGGCTRIRSGSGGRSVRGIRQVSTSANIGAKLCSINDININTTGNRFRFDDNFFMTLNNIVLVASIPDLYNSFTNVGGGLRRVSNAGNQLVDNNAGWPSANPPSVCIGGISGSRTNPNARCFVPGTDRSVKAFSVNLPQINPEVLAPFFENTEVLDLRVIGVGNMNSSSDCSVSSMTVELEIETVPSQCSCGTPTSFVRNCNINHDFENLLGGASYSSIAVSNQYNAESGITISSIGCGQSSPRLFRYGGAPVVYQTGNAIEAQYASRVGNYFISDDSTGSCDLAIDFDRPTEEFNFDFIDLDSAEVFTVRVYNQQGNLVAQDSYNNASVPGGGNHKPFNVSYSIPGESISRIVISSNAANIGFDNFKPFCAT